MSHRIFTDATGRRWEVWSVQPSKVERRRINYGPPPAVSERRRVSETRAFIGERWANGWLAFHTMGERRRLAPFPADWAQRSDEELVALCDQAEQVTPPRRLTE